MIIDLLHRGGVQAMSNSLRVAIIDDCSFFVRILTYQLSIRKIDVRSFLSCRLFTDSTQDTGWAPDVFVLDFDLGPGELNGIDACRLLREQHAKPVIILTGSDHLSRKERKMLSYEAGALQFLTKPHDINELVALIRNYAQFVSRPSQNSTTHDANASGIELYDNCHYFPFTRRVINDCREQVELTEKEGALLEVLLHNKNSIVDKSFAYLQIYGRPMHPLNRAIDNLACRLRTKLAAVCPDACIDNQRAMGYRLYHAPTQSESHLKSAQQR